jgi:Holliday junction resolvase
MTQTGTRILERDLQPEIIEYLEKMGAYVLKTHVSSFQKQGEPDITCCYLGRYIAFELKRDEKEKAKKLQEYKMKCIRKAGGIAMRVDNIKQVEEVLYEISRIQQGSQP